MSKILLLEDDMSLINGLSFAFQKQGHEPHIARTLTAPVLHSAKKSGLHRWFPLFF